MVPFSLFERRRGVTRIAAGGSFALLYMLFATFRQDGRCEARMTKRECRRAARSNDGCDRPVGSLVFKPCPKKL
jgi:hypothetical protein